MLDCFDLEAELKRHGLSKTAIAERCGCTRTFVWLVLHGRRKSPRVERALARAVGISAGDVRAIARRQAEADRKAA